MIQINGSIRDFGVLEVIFVKDFQVIIKLSLEL